MTTKQELIQICKDSNIFHRPSMSKTELEAAIEGGVKFGMPVECECPRSGLKFEVPIENVRSGAIHPKVSYYTSHKDTGIRYPAVAVIESQKWDSWEALESAIEAALNPEPPARPRFDFEGAWCAKITGSNAKYRFDREFVEEVDTEGRFKRFALAEAGDGLYECCYKSAKGNEQRYYYQVTDGDLKEFSLSEVEEMFPAVEAPKTDDNGLVLWQEDEDGIVGPVGWHERGVLIVREWYAPAPAK